jgi:hypothetical protein
MCIRDSIYCLNGSGDLRWRYRTNGEVWAGARVLPDGSKVIGGSNDQHVYVLDDTGELIWRYKLGGNVNITYPTPDGAFIAAGSTDSCVYLLNGDGQLLWKYRTGDSIYGVSLSRDAEFVVAASYDRHIYLFNREGDMLEKLRTGNQVYVVDITADGRFIGSFGFDKRVYLLENRYAARSEAERAEVHSILTQRIVGQLRRAFTSNLYYGLCYWFDQFNHLLRRNDFDLCDVLIAEARQEGYPLTAAEQRFVDSREGAVQLKRGIAAQRKGDFDAAEQFYRQGVLGGEIELGIQYHKFAIGLDAGVGLKVNHAHGFQKPIQAVIARQIGNGNEHGGYLFAAGVDEFAFAGRSSDAGHINDKVVVVFPKVQAVIVVGAGVKAEGASKGGVQFHALQVDVVFAHAEVEISRAEAEIVAQQFHNEQVNG